MSNSQISTEDRIKEAAKKVFLEKGFDGTTTRDIAKQAGLNCALMNYYFRSKQKLFSSVFEDMLILFFQGMTNILNKPISLKEKVVELVNHDFRTLVENPSLTNFVLNELHREPERFGQTFNAHKMVNEALLARQLEEASAKGEIRPIDIKNFFPLLMANIHFLFLCKSMTMETWNMTEADFVRFAEKHKDMVIEMVTDYLFLPQEVP
ncbi:TetR/AcrR family transcriptional regulator [Larkinella soli]|uniref:TetR/AcrR family transcriptional regulator n=1 Tax=Larkinella soli TaxID=1770527 RepID=UPI0013E3DE41|nr:TetR family transcriptional regulator [Larkinella soli]